MLMAILLREDALILFIPGNNTLKQMDFRKWKLRFGLGLIIFSVLVFLLLFTIPFLSLELKLKLALTPILLVAGEVMFWMGIVLIGKDVYQTFKAKLKAGAWRTSKQDQLKKPSK